MNNYGAFTASQYLSPLQPLEVSTGVNAGGYVRIVNNSPYLLNINFNGVGSYSMPEMFLEDFPVGSSYLGKVTITPSINLTNVSHATSNLISITIWNPGELQQPQAQPLNQSAVTATATGKPIFSTTVGFGATVHVGQQLNLFNPPNSGVNMTLHSVRVFTNDTSTPTANLMYTSGADLNFSGGSVPAVSHDGRTTPPVSFAHCTFVDTATQGFVQTSTIEVLDYPAGVETQDLLAFPDSYILEPGGNITIQLSSGASGKVVRLTMKWSEDIAVAAQGGVITGVATSIINEGNPLQNIVQATKQGDAAEDITITNAGTIVTNGVITANSGLNTNTIRDDITGNGVISVTGGAGAQNSRLQADTQVRLQVPQGVDVVTVTNTAITFAQQLKFIIGTLTRLSVFTGSASSAGTLQAHGLGVKPDFCVFQETNTTGDVNTFSWDVAASDATNVKVWSQNATARNYIALAIKL